MYPLFKIDALNGFIAAAIALFSVLTVVYSRGFMKGRKGLSLYYTYIIASALAALGVVLANNLILLAVFWGFLGLTLYLLTNMGDEKAPAAAKKTFIIIGGTDAAMLLGIGIIHYFTGTFQMDAVKLPLSGSWLVVLAYLCLAIAAFAKAGAMPFHTWIPDCAQSAPLPAVAFLPASLDKLLGIYLLARISMDLFILNPGMNIFLMLIGAITIIAAVMMALVQHDMKRLLGYHAVSQVGYMVLGIASATPIGIAGGLFHMLNHAIYKACLFFTCGNVEQKAGTVDLEKLGGLSKVMPLTYISCLIASLSICGIPPFNGFVSKWMIYQGLISQWQIANSKWQMAIYVISLAAAMFGSGLTLASFMKLLHAVFLGQATNERANERLNEVSWRMWLPCIILAGLCVVFGVFASQIPLKYFILPATDGAAFIGTWSGGLATLLIIAGFILGLLIFKLKDLKPVLRRDFAFTGAETADLPASRVSGAEFYNTVRELGVLKFAYKKAEAGVFDVYEQGKNMVFGIGRFFQFLHNGVLPTYLVWALLGMTGLFFILMRK